MSVAIEQKAPTVSVLIAGWDDVGDHPFRRKVESYGCTAVLMPKDALVVPRCDLAILAVRVSSHPFSERVRKACASWGVPVVTAKSGFEPARADFEAVLEKVREEKSKQRRVIVREKESCPVKKALTAEEKIREREEKEMSVSLAPVPKVDAVPTVESIIRRDYAARVSPADTAKELNRLGFKNMKGGAFTEGAVRQRAQALGCVRFRKGKSRLLAPQVRREELISSILASPLSAEAKVSYVERVMRGELTSLIDSGAKRDATHAVLWRTPIMEPARGVHLKLSKADACLVVEHFETIRAFAEAE